MAEGEFDHKPLGHKADDKSLSNGLEEEPDFSDPEDFVDEIDEQELLGDILKTRPRPLDGLENVIVVDRVPQVGPDRIDKLRTVLNKLFSKAGDIVNEHYPVDEKETTLGYVFVEYKTREAAADAVKLLDGHRLDKTHVFIVNLFTDIDKYSNIEETWEPPQPKQYVDRGNLKGWLLNPDAFDQYSVLHNMGRTASVYLNANPEPRLVKTRDNWTETEIVWSPLGTYLATYHKKGIAIWGGETFEQIMRFPHDDVKGINFSPRENYLVTFSHSLATFDDADAFIVWDVRTGTKKRSFHAERPNIVWPVFKWSHDDKYFARITQDTLSIYETPSMMLLDKKSIKVPGIKNFSWSPSQNLLAFWVAEDRDVPARVTLIEMPSRRELRSKNLFSVADCRMHWQKAGDYLCVKVDRYMRLKKEKTNDNKEKAIPIGLYFNFEIFHVKEKQIPVDSVEIKENIIAFAWEPIGDKFAIIHGDGAQSYSVSFYTVKSGVAVSLAKKLENKPYNHLFWSPSGQFIVLAGLKGSNNALEFIDTSDFTTTSTQEHLMATDVEWDPTGRYVVTGSSCWESRGDNNFWFWTFQGRLIRKVNLDGFCQFLWRPRPPTLLTEAKINEIKKNLKKYSPQFELKDKAAMSRISEEILAKRKQLMESFKAYREKREKEYQASLAKKAKLREGRDTVVKEEYEEERVEFLTREETVRG